MFTCCKNCKSLEEYAAICEQAANLIRIELTTLQNELSRISDQTTTTKQCVTPDLRPTVTSEQPIKLDHRTSFLLPKNPSRRIASLSLAHPMYEDYLASYKQGKQRQLHMVMQGDSSARWIRESPAWFLKTLTLSCCIWAQTML